VARDRQAHLAEIVNQAYERAMKANGKSGRGVILIPAFAVGRVQAVLDDLRQLAEARKIPNLEVVLDGRMSIAATEVHRKHGNLLNQKVKAVMAAGGDPFAPPRFRLAREWQDSVKLQEAQSEPLIIIGSSGMAAGGRIVSHLQARLGGRENTVVFVGYQGTGTLGNALTRFAQGSPNSSFRDGKQPAATASNQSSGTAGKQPSGKAGNQSSGSAGNQPSGTAGNQSSGKAGNQSSGSHTTVSIQGKPVRVRATIEFMSDYSGHADYHDIVTWMARFTQKPKLTFVVHGDGDALAGMRDNIVSRLGWDVVIPKPREVFELS
jgi:predicted metal-dependent RNase